MGFMVVQGVPEQLGDVREYESMQHGPQRSVGFHLGHPAVPKRDGEYRDLFEATNGAVDQVIEAGEAGAVVSLVCFRKRVEGRNGKSDWHKYVVTRVLV